MHNDFIDALLAFTKEYDLRFEYDFNSTLGSYRFRFQNQERTWGFCREISQDQFDTYAGNTVDFAYAIIDTLKTKIPIYQCW